MNLAKLSKTRLESLQREIAVELSGREEQEAKFAEARREAEALAEKHGISLGELIGEGRGKGGRIIKRRAPAEPKYRNPSNGEITWNGRGRVPKWVTAHVETHGSRDALLINNA